MKKKLSWHFYLVCAFIVVAALTLRIYFNQKLEYAYEMSDLQTMRSAEAVANLMWRQQSSEDRIEYWYDADSLELIPASDPMPNAYGCGTGRSGYALKKFDDEYAAMNGYSEKMDYTDKVLHVVVGSRDGKPEISMDWVSNE